MTNAVAMQALANQIGHRQSNHSHYHHRVEAAGSGFSNQVRSSNNQLEEFEEYGDEISEDDFDSEG